MSMSIVSTKNLTKSYKTTVAVNQVNMTIEKGQIYGLVGKNGAGKTTLMRLLLGLAFANTGEVSLFDESGTDRLKHKKRIGALIEQPVFYENLTAKENLEVHRLLCGIEDPSKIDEVLRLVHLNDTGKKKARQFSLGMKQRLGIAQALLNDPELLILDEPVNGLDPEGVKEIRDILTQLAKEKQITILISSHILNELQTIASHYGFMDKGYLIEEISAVNLRKKNESSLFLHVTDQKETIAILEQEFKISKYKVVADGQIEIYEKLESQQQIIKALIKADVDIIESKLKQRNLEEYFLDLVGNNHV